MCVNYNIWWSCGLIYLSTAQLNFYQNSLPYRIKFIIFVSLESESSQLSTIYILPIMATKCLYERRKLWWGRSEWWTKPTIWRIPSLGESVKQTGSSFPFFGLLVDFSLSNTFHRLLFWKEILWMKNLNL